ncbi:siderophore ABC transporter substrate-binding protein [Enterococcus gallinarum]|uniref:siderophore ABC transporter substrate-binding protein n=1 Tax=Enterococcus gallinarum TaxID=1353 RepID=UPI00288FE923|nr:siderophore ABC transporter substrate-binding protein [Enterococcus gallinarum]MDT2721069.1 siderophore ABC transporter substrate-binding protein [Enterococcus gallinarum]
MKKIVFSLAVLVMITGLAGCGSQEKGESTSASTAAAALAEIEVTDSNGKVTVPFSPKKVVVFDNSALDTMDALGVGDRVVGAATSNMPDYLKSYAAVDSAGGIKEPDLEKINQIQPDLIIISGRQRDFQKDLEAIAPTIFLSVDNENTWSSIDNNIQTIAQIFGKEEEAKKQLTALQTRIANLSETAEASKEKALVVMMNEGSLSAFGLGSRYSIVYDTFGFTPVDDTLEASTHGQNISYEYLLEKNPDIIFVIDRTKAIGGDTSQSTLTENELVQQTTAGKNGKVIELNPQVWYLAGSGIESLDIMLSDVEPAVAKD